MMWWKEEKNDHHFPPLCLFSFWGTGTQGLPKPNGTSIFHEVLFSKFAYMLFGPKLSFWSLQHCQPHHGELTKLQVIN